MAMKFLGAGMAMIVGAVMGASAVSVLHAQTKPPAYLISEITVTNPQAFGKEFAPKARASVKAHGGRIIAVGGAGGAGAGSITVLQGDAPRRLVIQQWPSVDAIKKWWDSPEYKAARVIGDKYAKFRVLAVEAFNPK